MTPFDSPVLVVASLAIVVVMGAALVSDVRSRRIPNRLTATGLVAGLTVNALLGWSALAGSVAAAALALLVSFPLFALGALGGGDAKLLAVAGAFLGLQGLFVAALAAGVVGGVLAVVEMVRRGVTLPVLLSAKDLIVNLATLGWKGSRPSLRSPGAVKVPYGVAIALGSLVAWFIPLFGGTI